MAVNNEEFNKAITNTEREIKGMLKLYIMILIIVVMPLVFQRKLNLVVIMK